MMLHHSFWPGWLLASSQDFVQRGIYSNTVMLIFLLIWVKSFGLRKTGGVPLPVVEESQAYHELVGLVNKTLVPYFLLSRKDSGTNLV